MAQTPLQSADRTPGTRLLERERELESLARLVAGAVAGDGFLAVVEGPPGIGKTRLIAEARRAGEEAGMCVLSARGGELEREFAFGVVRQLFEPLLAAEDGRPRALAGAAGPAAAVFATPDGPAGAAAADASFAVLHGLFWLTLNLSADRPLLLAIDDLHWCDHASLRFLAYLVRRLEGVPVLCVAGLRPAEPGVDSALVAEIAADPATVVLRPPALSRSAVAELAGARLGRAPDPAFADACAAATGGNPLLLNELLKALAAEGVEPVAEHAAMVDDLGPRAASRAVLLRLARLPVDATAVARALAVAGDGADLRAVAALAGVDERRAARATGDLARAEILRPEPPLGFVHPLVAAAVYRDIPPGERALQHEHAAQVLRAAGAPVERVAAHVLAVTPRGDEEAVDILRTAAAAALAKGAPDSAVAYLERAVAEPPGADRRAEVLVELGRAEAFTNGPAAAEHLRQGYDLLVDAPRRAGVAQMLARALLFTGRPEEGAVVAREAAAALGREHVEFRRALEAFAWAPCCSAPATTPTSRGSKQARWSRPTSARS